MKKVITTQDAPKALGTYSQGIRSGDVVYISGQIPMDPATMNIVTGDFASQVARVFENLKAVAQAAGGSLEYIVKLTIFLTDLNQFATVNEVMAKYFHEPYPARSTIQVSALPKGVGIEIEGIMVL